MRVLTTYKLKRLQNKVTVLQQLTQAFENEDEIKDFCKDDLVYFAKIGNFVAYTDLKSEKETYNIAISQDFQKGIAFGTPNRDLKQLCDIIWGLNNGDHHRLEFKCFTKNTN
jgi:hypothetical protein